MTTEQKRPWWRHWHVWGHDAGYTLREAKETQAHEAKTWGEPLEEWPITRCDIDHSGTVVETVGRWDRIEGVDPTVRPDYRRTTSY